MDASALSKSDHRWMLSDYQSKLNHRVFAVEGRPERLFRIPPLDIIWFKICRRRRAEEYPGGKIQCKPIAMPLSPSALLKCNAISRDISYLEGEKEAESSTTRWRIDWTPMHLSSIHLQSDVACRHFFYEWLFRTGMCPGATPNSDRFINDIISLARSIANNGTGIHISMDEAAVFRELTCYDLTMKATPFSGADFPLIEAIVWEEDDGEAREEASGVGFGFGFGDELPDRWFVPDRTSVATEFNPDSSFQQSETVTVNAPSVCRKNSRRVSKSRLLRWLWKSSRSCLMCRSCTPA